MVEEFGSPSSFLKVISILKTLAQNRYYWLAKQSIKL